MAQYNLTVLLSAADTEAANAAGLMITIIKGPPPAGPIGGPDTVVWAATPPFEQNAFSWNDTYGLYAAPTPSVEVALAMPMSSVYPAVLGKKYLFQNNVFHPPTEGEPARIIAVNQTLQTLNFGLLQALEANLAMLRPRPTSAFAVQPNTEVVFTPPAQVTVFMQSRVDTGSSVISKSGPTLTLDMKSNPDQTVHYVASTMGFAVGGL